MRCLWGDARYCPHSSPENQFENIVDSLESKIRGPQYSRRGELWEVRDRQIEAIRPKPDGVTFPSYHDAELTIMHAGSGLDDRAGFRRLVPAGLTDESLDALISAGEAMRIHQILPDRFGVAASESPHFDDLGIGFAGAG